MIKKIGLTVAVVSLSLFAIGVEEILDKVEANENSQTSKTVMTQTVYKSNGSKSVSELTSYSADKGDKSIMIYSKPSRIKGMKILSLNDGDDIWFYSPRTARSRKIASGQKGQSVNGSDFSYEDMDTKDSRKDYTNTLSGEEKIGDATCYKIDMKAKPDADVSYSRTVSWVDKEKFMPLKMEFYDEYNELWKVLTLKDVTKIGKYWSAKSIEMKNVQKGSRTVMETGTVEFDIEVDMGMFTERYLKR